MHVVRVDPIHDESDRVSDVLEGGRMTGADAFRIAVRILEKSGREHLSPWRQRGIMIVAAENDLVGWRYSRMGWPLTVAVMVDYEWLPDQESYPGEELAKMLDKPVHVSAGEGPGTPFTVSADDAKRFPTLTDYMTQGKWPDGSDRELSKVNFWFDGNTFKIMMRDPATNRVLFVAAVSLDKLLVTLEAVLKRPDADWRADKGPPGKRGGKK